MIKIMEMTKKELILVVFLVYKVFKPPVHKSLLLNK